MKYAPIKSSAVESSSKNILTRPPFRLPPSEDISGSLKEDGASSTPRLRIFSPKDGIVTTSKDEAPTTASRSSTAITSTHENLSKCRVLVVDDDRDSVELFPKYFSERLFSSVDLETFKNDLKVKNIAQNLDEKDVSKINAMGKWSKVDFEFNGRTYVVEKTEKGALIISINLLKSIDIAETASDALSKISEAAKNGKYDFVLCDIRLDGEKSGIDVEKEARTLSPGTKFVFVSALPLDSFPEGKPALQKPIHQRDLLDLLNKLCDS